MFLGRFSFQIIAVLLDLSLYVNMSDYRSYNYKPRKTTKCKA